MVLEILALFPRLAPFKVITLDDGWDQLNRSFMFILCVLFGSIVTIRCYTGSVIECDGFVKVSSSSVFNLTYLLQDPGSIAVRHKQLLVLCPPISLTHSWSLSFLSPETVYIGYFRTTLPSTSVFRLF